MRLSHSLSLLIAVALPAAAIAHVVPLKNAAGGSAGSVDILAAPKGLLLKVDATGLTPGWHAIHIHEKGDCSDAAFKNAGGHVHDATPVVHGLLNPQANDKGDLTNIYAGADGTAKAEIFTPLTMMAPLHDADGSAIVIHAKADDYTTQPIGGAGDRVACGAFK
ncbi:superoxide dismutase family protein [Sphingomonas sp.]|uniref:superoxide dismutase family protein n=1 Tax=Sphingomonas sp. TaxID=28214 RepID=UPI000DB6EC35|nr:superoxide dismutase family protein [Sphingomonas sp.]PZU06588.1 MAG: superoxide dismutase [Sphingomonas sp.]